MKKIFTSLLLASMVLMSGMTAAFALTHDESYAAVKEIYGKKTELTSADEVITYESLGLQSDALPMKDVVKSEYASEIAKTVIALTLHGNDPRDYEGVNYVDMLEKCVQENGAFDKTNTSTYANFQIYGVYALYVVNSAKATIAADYLASLIGEDGSFGSSFGPSLDVTAWGIEALSLVNKTRYQATIDKALANLQAARDGNAGYVDSFSGVNANTQACVLMGLLAYDQTGVKGTTYNQGDKNPYDVLLTFQNDNGSFWYTSAGENNDYATVQASQAIGYFYQGSVYTQAYKEYQKLITPVETKKEETKEKPKSNKAGVVNTADASELFVYMGLLVVSGFMMIKGKKFVG